MNELEIRELKKEDLENGFLTTLDSLRRTSNVDRNKAEEIFEKINSNPDHIVIVAELDGKVVGAATTFGGAKIYSRWRNSRSC